MSGSTSAVYAYDPANQRVYTKNASGAETIYFYGADGKKLASYSYSIITYNGNPAVQLTLQTQNMYFMGKLISAEGNAVTVDRLGSVRSGGPGGLGAQAQFPYGVEYTTTTNDREKYATYTRDSVTGLDYAMNRYYSSQWGRFLSTDPFGGSAKLGSPQTWNRYSYTRSDPVNRTDPSGLWPLQDVEIICYDCDDPIDDPFDGGSSGGPSKPTQRVSAGNSNFPECNPTGNPTTERTLTFIANNYADASSVTAKYDVPVEWILGWSAWETNYGADSPSKLNNNFFGEEKAVTQTVGQWNGEVPCPNGSYFGTAKDNSKFNYSCFTDFAGSANAAMATFYGGIISEGFAEGVDLVHTFDAVYAAGWDKSQATTAGDKIQGTQKRITTEIECLKAHDYIQ